MSDPADRPADQAGPDVEQAEAASPANKALAALRELLATGSDLAGDYLELLAVEGRLAGRSLVLMLALGIALALLLVGAWIFLALAATTLLIELGLLRPWLALLAVALAHLAMALLAWLTVRRLSDNLVFSGLRASLRRENPGDSES